MIEEEIVVIGGGIAGLATALALKRVGFQARVEHKLKSLVTNLDTGAIQELGLSGTKENREDTGVITVHRKALLETLAEELLPDTIRFSSKLISIKSETLEDSSKATLLHLEDGTVIKAKVLGRW
ncbi:monooxygenase 3-like [Carex rostrata]